MKLYLPKDKLLLVSLFLIIHLGLLLTFGIYTKEESVKYIKEADYLIQYHHFSHPKYFFYFGYIALQMLCQWSGTGIIGVYLIQLTINGIATICYYKLILSIASRKSTAFLATLLLICSIPFQKWTVYLFTESFFFSLLIVYTYILFHKSIPINKKIILDAFVFCLILISRPTGVLIIPATIMLLSFYFFKKKQFTF